MLKNKQELLMKILGNYVKIWVKLVQSTKIDQKWHTNLEKNVKINSMEKFNRNNKKYWKIVDNRPHLWK